MSHSENRLKTKLIQVRATPEEKDKLKARAVAFGISMGELCRQIIFGAKPKSKTDQDAIRELAAMRADLGRLGGLLKGWLSDSFPAAPTPDRNQVRELLENIQAAQLKIVGVVSAISKEK